MNIRRDERECATHLIHVDIASPFEISLTSENAATFVKKNKTNIGTPNRNERTNQIQSTELSKITFIELMIGISDQRGLSDVGQRRIPDQPCDNLRLGLTLNAKEPSAMDALPRRKPRRSYYIIIQKALHRHEYRLNN